MKCYQIAIKDFIATNVGFELYFNNFFLSSVVSLTSTRFLMFFIVLPKTLLFISLKKSFSNHYLAAVRFFVIGVVFQPSRLFEWKCSTDFLQL